MEAKTPPRALDAGSECDASGMKTCSKCRETKPLEAFDRGVRRTECKLCRKAYREANRELMRAQAKEHYERNAEKVRAKAKAYREANRETVRATKKDHYERNAPRERARAKTYLENNRDKMRAYKKAYRETSADKVRAYRESLAPGYVAATLRLPVDQLTPELLEAKRQQLEISRALKALNATLKEKEPT